MVQKNSINLIIVCGPTASGKTALAVELAKNLNSEIVYADSMDIYTGLNVGTAKPTKEEKCGIKHHMIDVVSPREQFTVFDYRETAKPIIDNLINKGKIPIICGGTGFYINSLLYNLSYGKGTGDVSIREKYKQIAQEKGSFYVYNLLKQVDPESANKIHENDLKRVIRALEIYESGTKKSDIKDDKTPNYNYLAVSPNPDRSVLYERINSRVDKMFDLGLVEEVKGLYFNGITENFQCMQGIGYKEIIPYIKGETSLYQTKENIKINTRHYAKRQITFFKQLENLTYLENDTPQNLAKKITENL